MKLASNLAAIFVVITLVLGVGVIAWNLMAPSTGGAIVRVTVPRLSGVALAGRKAFDANCASCHGENGAGTDQGPPLIHDIYNPGHHDDGAFFRAARSGVPRHHWNFSDMPPQPHLSGEELAAIVRYIRELQQANGIFWKPHRM